MPAACPVCGEPLPPAGAAAHVNACLDRAARGWRPLSAHLRPLLWELSLERVAAAASGAAGGTPTALGRLLLLRAAVEGPRGGGPLTARLGDDPPAVLLPGVGGARGGPAPPPRPATFPTVGYAGAMELEVALVGGSPQGGAAGRAAAPPPPEWRAAIPLSAFLSAHAATHARDRTVRGGALSPPGPDAAPPRAGHLALCDGPLVLAPSWSRQRLASGRATGSLRCRLPLAAPPRGGWLGVRAVRTTLLPLAAESAWAAGGEAVPPNGPPAVLPTALRVPPAREGWATGAGGRTQWLVKAAHRARRVASHLCCVGPAAADAECPAAARRTASSAAGAGEQTSPRAPAAAAAPPSPAPRVSVELEGVYLPLGDVRGPPASLPSLTPLHRAAADGRVDVLRALLVACGPAALLRRTRRVALPLPSLPAAAAAPPPPPQPPLALGDLTVLDVAILAGRADVVEAVLAVQPPSPRLSMPARLHAVHLAVLGGDLRALRAVASATTAAASGAGWHAARAARLALARQAYAEGPHCVDYAAMRATPAVMGVLLGVVGGSGDDGIRIAAAPADVMDTVVGLPDAGDAQEGAVMAMVAQWNADEAAAAAAATAAAAVTAAGAVASGPPVEGGGLPSPTTARPASSRRSTPSGASPPSPPGLRLQRSLGRRDLELTAATDLGGLLAQSRASRPVRDGGGGGGSAEGVGEPAAPAPSSAAAMRAAAPPPHLLEPPPRGSLTPQAACGWYLARLASAAATPLTADELGSARMGSPLALTTCLAPAPTGHGSLDVADRLGRTPLAYACALGNIDAARALLRWGACAGATDGDGDTPLTTALRCGHAALALHLLARVEPDAVAAAREAALTGAPLPWESGGPGREGGSPPPPPGTPLNGGPVGALRLTIPQGDRVTAAGSPPGSQPGTPVAGGGAPSSPGGASTEGHAGTGPPLVRVIVEDAPIAPLVATQGLASPPALTPRAPVPGSPSSPALQPSLPPPPSPSAASLSPPHEMAWAIAPSPTSAQRGTCGGGALRGAAAAAPTAYLPFACARRPSVLLHIQRGAAAGDDALVTLSDAAAAAGACKPAAVNVAGETALLLAARASAGPCAPAAVDVLRLLVEVGVPRSVGARPPPARRDGEAPPAACVDSSPRHPYRALLEDVAGESPLHAAAKRGSLPAVRALCWLDDSGDGGGGGGDAERAIMGVPLDEGGLLDVEAGAALLSSPRFAHALARLGWLAVLSDGGPAGDTGTGGAAGERLGERVSVLARDDAGRTAGDCAALAAQAVHSLGGDASGAPPYAGQAAQCARLLARLAAVEAWVFGGAP